MKIVLDTNVFVAAGFNPDSHSARILGSVRDGTFRMIWHASTRAETRRMLDRIPHLFWQKCEALFKPEDEVQDVLRPEDYDFVPDVDDRKFAALAEVAACPLVTSDSDLLSNRHRLSVPVMTPREFLAAGS